MSKPNTTARRTRVERGIYTRPDGSFEIGFRDASGRQRWKAVHGGIRAARAALAEAHAQRARGERRADNPRLTFPAASDAWWEARALRLRPSTQSAYSAALRHLLKPENFGRSRMAEISPADVARFVANQQRSGLKGWTIKGHLTVLSSVFSFSNRHLGVVCPNPVGLLDSVERPSSDDEKPKRVLNNEELARLLAAIEEEHRLLFQLASETGARLSEVLGLARGDVHVEQATVTFTHQLDRKGQRQPLKTRRSRRCLEITPELALKLRLHFGAHVGPGDHSLVFTSRLGTPLDQRNIGGRVLARAVARAGLGSVRDSGGRLVLSAPTFHDLRHSHASALIAGGWDIAEVSARLGHASVSTTQRIYIHEFDVAARSAGRRDRLAQLYGGALPPDLA